MNAYQIRNTIRIALGLAALLLLSLFAIAFPREITSFGFQFIVVLVAVAVIVNFNIPLYTGEGSLVHLVGLAAVLLFTPTRMVAAVVGGVLLGGLVRSFWRFSPSFRDMPRDEQWGFLAFDIAHQIVSLMLAAVGYRLAGGKYPLVARTNQSAIALAGYVVGFLVGYILMLLIDLGLRAETLQRYLSLNGGRLALIAILPLPIAIYAVLASNQFGVSTFTIFAVLACVIAIVVHNFTWAQITAEKRLRELSLLNKVSQAMGSNLDLDTLLETIYAQVASLIGVANFYIALYEPETETISFPIAIQNGQRVHWNTRKTASRLTDYVIVKAEPLLVPYDMTETLKRLRLETGDNNPEAWCGVPLIANDRAIGCLAIITYVPGETITQETQTLLTTVAGQAGIALENAQIYGQISRRATELATLTEISAAISASLDPERVLELVCSSVNRVFNAEKSAIFLLDKNRQVLELARAKGLTEAYLLASRSISLENSGRVRAVTTGQPVVIADVKISKLPREIIDLSRTEGFAAYAELPLVAQGEMIGVMAAYFAQPHQFRASEIELLRTFASQAALAVANARLFARTDQALVRRVDQLQALDTISRELTSMLDLDRLFDLILSRAMDFTNATLGSLYLHNVEKNILLVVAWRGYSPEIKSFDLNKRAMTETSVTGRVQKSGEIHLVPDVRADLEYVSVSEQTQSMLSVPIKRESQTLGVMTLEAPTLSAFDKDDANFASQLAAQAAIAIENARLFQRVTEGRDRLSAVLNSTREGVLVIDAKGRVVLMNPRIETMWAIDRSQLVDQYMADLLGQEDLGIAEKLGFTPQTLLQLLSNLAEGMTFDDPKQTYRVTSPAVRFFERSGTPMYDETRRVIGWVIVLRDVTEEKDLEQIREEVTAMIVHDLRSPMTSVLGGLKLIEDVVVPTDQTGILAQAVEVSLRSSKKLLNLVDSLLDISKMEAGQMHLDERPTALDQIAAGVVDEQVQVANQQSVFLLNEVPADLPQLLIDSDKVERVLTNLVDNALKFTPTNGFVIVRASPYDDVPSEDGRSFVLCQVLDTGPGIPDDYRARIFDRFAQVRGRQGRRRGTGLGLAFCKLAVEAHGGKIWVESRPEGGSAFNFTLPAA
ncbi:MAG: GAF domain-containing protein [Chloroflexi bacterium]|nr:GAF domain-containing protein [Chloroflexota bacterium]